MNLRQLAGLLTLALTLIVNSLANALPINGRTTGAISDSFPVLFVPAGYVFSIWGVIYLGLIAFGVYQALPSKRDNPRLVRAGWWFSAANILNASWIFLWHYGQYAGTLVVMLGLLTALIVLYVRLGIGRVPSRGIERLVVDLPFGIYLGWISVATVANASATLYSLGWNGGSVGPVGWTLVMLAVATLLGVAMTGLRREVAYPLVLVWAFVGIAAKQAGVPAVATASWIGAAVVATGLLVALVVRARSTSGRSAVELA